MDSRLSDSEIRNVLDGYLEEHYGNEPVLSIIPSKDIHELKFQLVEDIITLVCDEKGNITEKKRKRRLPKSEVEGQLSFSDILLSPKSDNAPADEEEKPALSEEKEPAEESSPRKKTGSYSDGQRVVNIFTGDIYTVVSTFDNMLRVRPEGELSTIMLTAADVKEVTENE